MIRSVSILMLVVLWANINTSWTHIFKLPVLLSHFHEHQVLDETLSLTDYIYQHYIDDNNYGDYARDQQLPLKDLSNIGTLIPLAVVENPVVLYEVYKKVVVYSISMNMPIYELKIGAVMSYHGEIFQPPKFV